LRGAKLSGEFRDEDHWLGFFDKAAQAQFWWPSDEKVRELKIQLEATPVSERMTDRRLQRAWLFGSMIEAIRDGEVELVGCERGSGSIGRLEFIPWTQPFGGTPSLKAWLNRLDVRLSQKAMAENSGSGGSLRTSIANPMLPPGRGTRYV